MAFQPSSPEELAALTQAALAAVRGHPGNPLLQPQNLTFLQIEQLAHQIGQQVAAGLAQQALTDHADQQPEHAPCPPCGLGCRLTRKKRTLQTLDGPLDYREPAAHCVVCRRDFFPDTPPLETR